MLTLYLFDIRKLVRYEIYKEAVSIIITCYNYAHFLDECLKSVFKQTYTNLEVILVDDGSTDNTKAVTDKYGRRLNYIYQDNQGLSAARNTGLKQATGSYILFLDADDVLGKDSINQRVEFLKQNKNIDVAICKNYFFTDKPEENEEKYIWQLPSEPIEVAFMRFNIAPSHAYLIRTSCIVESVRFDNKLKACEDYDFWLQILAKGCIYGLSKGHVYYRKHAESMSEDTNKQWLHDGIMHLRVFKNFEGVLQTNLLSLIAYLQGCVLTCSRLSEEAANIQSDLTVLIEKAKKLLIFSQWHLSPTESLNVDYSLNVLKEYMPDLDRAKVNIQYSDP